MNFSELLNRNFFLRLASALVLGSITFFCLIEGGFLFSLFILAITIISYLEWFNIVANNLPQKNSSEYKKYILFWSILGMLVLLPSSASLLYIRYILSLSKVFLLLAIIVTTDIAGYIFGRLIGGPKLWPSISPGKTISGALAGIICSVIIAVIMKFLMNFEGNYVQIAIFSVIISVLSQIGGLCISKFKRHIGVKDSSNLIPGHGGFLDRVDSFIFTAPIFIILDLLKLL